MNLHYFFYHDYYEEIKGGNVITANDKIYNHEFDLNKCPENISTDAVQLTVSYPGLLIGTGYNHEAGIKEEIICGFSFDYVTGMPYLPGSSLKGILRSAFKHPDYIKELLSSMESGNTDVATLENEIFEGIDKDGNLLKTTDVFYDSFPSAANFNNILAEEIIAPHNCDVFKSPNPLTVLKIRPETSIKFRFKIQDGIICKEKKSELFKNILLDFGVGAKTNVGFGFLVPYKEIKETKQEQGGHRCRNCGGHTGINQKTNQYYDLCNKCSSRK